MGTELQKAELCRGHRHGLAHRAGEPVEVHLPGRRNRVEKLLPRGPWGPFCLAMQPPQEGGPGQWSVKFQCPGKAYWQKPLRS